MTKLKAIASCNRNYETESEVLAAWANGETFVLQGIFDGHYIVRWELTKGETLEITYDRGRKSCLIHGE